MLKVENNAESDWTLISVFIGEWQCRIRKFLSISKTLHSGWVVNGCNNQLTGVSCRALLKTKNRNPDILIILQLQEHCRYKWCLQMTAILCFWARAFVKAFFVNRSHKNREKSQDEEKISKYKVKGKYTISLKSCVEFQISHTHPHTVSSRMKHIKSVDSSTLSH